MKHQAGVVIISNSGGSIMCFLTAHRSMDLMIAFRYFSEKLLSSLNKLNLCACLLLVGHMNGIEKTLPVRQDG